MRLSISLPPVCPKRLVRPTSVPAASTLPIDFLEAGGDPAHSNRFAGRLAEKCGPGAARRVYRITRGIVQQNRYFADQAFYECANMSSAAQPMRSSRTRSGRKLKQLAARSV